MAKAQGRTKPRNYNATIKALSRRLREVRESLGMTQEAVAERLHMVPRHYQKVEAGDLNITLGTLCKLALVLRTTPRDLLDD